MTSASAPEPRPSNDLLAQYHNWAELVKEIKSEVLHVAAHENLFSLEIIANDDLLRAEKIITILYRINGEHRKVERHFSTLGPRDPEETLKSLITALFEDLRRVLEPEITRHFLHAINSIGFHDFLRRPAD